MSRTLIVIDPMGFNLTSLGMQYLLLKGTLVEPGDTVYRLPYTNQAGASNIAGGVTALNNKLNSTAGDILVFGYSEGAQVATKWLRDHGTSSPVTPTSRLKFLLIGNAERRYGGFGYKHDNLADIMDVDGLPDPLEDGTSTVHYEVTDFARQYDGFADFPSAPGIQQAVDSVAAALSDPFNWALKALQDVVNAVIGNHKDAALNAVLGMQMVHTNYFTVTPNDPHNVRFIDPDHPLVEYVWSPTYPVPLLGIGQTFPSLDRDKRKVIEQSYTRPVVLPQPNYAQISLFTTDFFSTDEDFRRADETGWFPEVHIRFGLTVSPVLGMSTFIPTQMGLAITPGLDMAATAHYTAAFGLDVTPGLDVSAVGASSADFGLSVTVGLSMSTDVSFTSEFTLAITPVLEFVAQAAFGSGIGLNFTVSLDMQGSGVSPAAFGLSLSPDMSMAAVGVSVAQFGLVVASALGMAAGERYVSEFDLGVVPEIDMAGVERYLREFDLSVTPELDLSGGSLESAEAELAVSPDIGMAGAGTSLAGFSLDFTPLVVMAPEGRAQGAFTVGVTPVVSMDGVGASPASFGFGVTPELGMSAAATSAGVFGLDVPVSVDMAGAGVSVAGFGLGLAPGLGMAESGTSVAVFGVELVPAVGMDGAGTSTAVFSVDVAPTVGMSGAERYARDFGLVFAPELGMAGAEHYADSFTVGVTVGFGMGAAENIAASMELSVPASMTMAGGEHYARDFGLTVTPDVGMTGTVIEAAVFGLSITPSLGMAGVGASSAVFGVGVAPAVVMDGAGVSLAGFGLSVSVSVGMSGTGHDGVTFTPTLVSVTTPGSYSVPWPEGATKCDVVLCGAGSCGASLNTHISDPGEDTTATYDGSTLTAPGGPGYPFVATVPTAPSSDSNGKEPGGKTYNSRPYSGGTGGGYGDTIAGTPHATAGTQPGAGGGSGWAAMYGQGLPGGPAGSWAVDTITKSVSSPITGTVGAGAAKQAYNDSGAGGDGIAHFYFYL